MNEQLTIAIATKEQTLMRIELADIDLLRLTDNLHQEVDKSRKKRYKEDIKQCKKDIIKHENRLKEDRHLVASLKYEEERAV